MPVVSTLEFIVRVQWPLLVLLLTLIVCIAAALSKGLREVLKKIRIRLNIAGNEVEVAPGQAEEVAEETAGSLAVAAKSDEELQALAEKEGAAQDAERVTTFRREAVEALMRDAAHWGWHQAHMGFKRPPDPYVDWDAESGPRILYGASSGPDLAAVSNKNVRSYLADPTEVGRRIRRERSRRHMSLEELSARSGVDSSALRRLESGEMRGVSKKTIDRLATALGTPVERFTSRHDRPEPPR